MEAADVIEVAQDGILTLLAVAGPLLAIALLVGLVIALFQTLTQIQEMTLTFVPKIVVIFFSLMALLPSMGSTLNGFWVRILERIAAG